MKQKGVNRMIERRTVMRDASLIIHIFSMLVEIKKVNGFINLYIDAY